MSIDMSQFHAVFLEESAEHLDEIEHLLMSLDTQAPDPEQLNSIFRAAHSIKGGAGIFGFEALISVTHVMENLFDKARQGNYQLTANVVDQLLTMVDVLRGFLNQYAHQQPIDSYAVDNATSMMEQLLVSTTTKKQEADQGFGFFETTEVSTKTESTDQGFGFFDEPKPADAGFGFFDDEPVPAVASTTLSTEPLATQSNITAADTGAESPSTVTEKKLAEGQAASERKVVDVPKAKANDESSSIRVDIQKIDSLVNLVGELVITQSMLTLIGEDFEGPQAEKLQTALRELEQNTRDLQEGIMSIRMLPMSFVFNRFPRVVRDLSSKLKKQVELVIEGGQTEIDKGLIEKLVDPLTHLVRNSLDHGIESPEIRQQRNKDSTGTLTLKAEQKGGNILISVCDDGGGLNREKILNKAWERGLQVSESASDEDVWQLIMAPGFSTADQVTDVSGRGVGMDVVKRNIEAMGGKIDIQSVHGQGTTMQIRLPLTLAIVDGMSVSVGRQLFIIPLVNIVESMQPTEEQLVLYSNKQMLRLREAYWPIHRLHELMDVEPDQKDLRNAILVLVETSRSKFALMVDDLLGQQQVVIKSLEQHYRRVAGIAGATIMGDGSVALILDVESLTNLQAEKMNPSGLVEAAL